jgi:YVTN family beta-propeller protein
VTGQVYNAASDFPDQPLEFPVSGPASNLSSGTPVPIGTVSGAAKFVFVTTDGTINAWRASTAESMDRAVIVKDYSDHGRDQIKGLRFLPAFTGVAMSVSKQVGNRLYVTDFQNHTIRVIDNQWRDVTASVPFTMPAGIPANFSPDNIQFLNGRLYVAFAAIDTVTGAFRDYLRESAGKPIVIDKIWALAFGNGVSLGDADSLYFTAGPNEEQDGIFGRLRSAAAR